MAPAPLVWFALVDGKSLSRWMLDGVGEVSSDWKPGSAVNVVSKFNGVYRSKGVVLVADPPRLLRYSSWTKISRLRDTPENYSIIEFALTQKDDLTTVQLTHENLIAKAAYEHSGFYWGTALLELKKVVEGLKGQIV
jgi:uncharacterized protein YndB with AHSA1/START domain